MSRNAPTVSRRRTIPSPARPGRRLARMATPEIMQVHPLIEEILDEHRDHARGNDSAYADYKAHVYRVLNFARALLGENDDAATDDKLAIAAAFHDIDAFSGLD